MGGGWRSQASHHLRGKRGAPGLLGLVGSVVCESVEVGGDVRGGEGTAQ